MNKHGKTISKILILGLVVALCFISLFGCTKKKDQARQKAVVALENSIVKIYDKDYTADKSDIEILLMKGSGKYVVAKAWAEFYSRILNNSKLQTSKIEKIAKLIANQNIVESIDNIEIFNKDIFTAFKDLGLNSVDVSSFFTSFINEITTTNFAKKHYETASKLLAFAEDRHSLGQGIAVLDSIKESIDIIKRNQESLLNIKQNAKKVETFIETIYKMGDLPISKKMIDIISTNAKREELFKDIFKDSTKEEIKTYFKLMLDSTIDLYDKIKWAQGQEVTKDIKGMAKVFKEALIPSPIISDAIDYIDAANGIMQYADFQKDILKEVREAVDDEEMNIMDDIYEIAKSEKKEEEYMLIIPLAKVLKKIADKPSTIAKLNAEVREKIHTSDLPQAYGYVSNIISTLTKGLSESGTIDSIMNMDIRERSLRKAYIRKETQRNMELIGRKLKWNKLNEWQNGINLGDITGIFNDCVTYVGLSTVAPNTSLTKDKVISVGNMVRDKIENELASDIIKNEITNQAEAVINKYFEVVNPIIEKMAKLKLNDPNVKTKIEELYEQLRGELWKKS